MSEFTSGNAPGYQAATEAEESEVTWSGRKGQDLIATRQVTIGSATVDSGNTPTTTLRGGNLLAIVDATGKVDTYSADANDGRQIAVGILEHYQDMLVAGVATDRFTQMLVHGLLKESELLNLDPRALGRFDPVQLAVQALISNVLQPFFQLGLESVHPSNKRAG